MKNKVLIRIFFIILLQDIMITSQTIDKNKKNLGTTIARTEIKISRSLNPEDTESLNVVTKDGSIAQLIVKRRDPKSPKYQLDLNNNNNKIVSNWIPSSHNYYYQNKPKIITLNSLALLKNNTKIIDSDRIPNVPQPITINSKTIYLKNTLNDKNDKKRARSNSDDRNDGIPIVQGVRVPDDVTEQTWRNARVINGQLVPYEQGYKPPAAVPLGQLIFATTENNHETTTKNFQNIGPFTTQDNFKAEQLPSTTTNQEDKIKLFNSQSSVGFGPFTKYDNDKIMDYIKEINEKEAKKDYNKMRKFRSYGQPQVIQRRMLQNPGQPTFPESKFYAKNPKLSPGIRTPVLQYAHPDLGIQPAKVSPEEPYQEFNSDGSGRKSGSYEPYNNYYRKDIINYPYNTIYIKSKPLEQPLWMKLTETIKDNVQNGFERMHQLTKPVFDPLIEATHKISYNLGFSRNPNEKIGLITPAANSVILPALGLVAGGAALGLGAAAVGRFLNPQQMRAFHNDFIVIMDKDNDNGNVDNDQVEGNNRKFKRSVDYYQILDDGIMDDDNELRKFLMTPHIWSDTPCAKKLFCQVMVHRNSDDDVILMEKKIDTLLSKIHPTIAKTVTDHLQETMDAVKSRDCGRFLCSKRITYPLSFA